MTTAMSTHTAQERQDREMPVRVFLLDDHELVRRGIRDLLWAEDDMAVVGDASTAEEALERIPQTRPDVAVLDVRLGARLGYRGVPGDPLRPPRGGLRDADQLRR